jgi:hypothetical protein
MPLAIERARFVYLRSRQRGDNNLAREAHHQIKKMGGIVDDLDQVLEHRVIKQVMETMVDTTSLEMMTIQPSKVIKKTAAAARKKASIQRSS